MQIYNSLSLKTDTFEKQYFIKQTNKHGVPLGLTSDGEHGGAAVSAVQVGSLAGVFIAVGFDRVQELQGGNAVAAEDPELLALFDLNARLVPFEGHTWSVVDFTFELGLAADVDLQREDFQPKDRWH